MALKKTAKKKTPAKGKAATKKPAKKKSTVKASPRQNKKKAAKPTKKKVAKPTKKTVKPTKKAAQPIKNPAKITAKPIAKAKAPAKVKPKQHKPLVRRDATGHLNPQYEHDLRRASRENQEHDDDRGFLVGKNADEPLAQELGREFVETVNSGEDEGVELRDELVDEELGGPFVTTTVGQEEADGVDESNPIDATREPFPKT